MLALENFLMVVVLPIAAGTGLIYLFRWWLRRSTGYDPLGDKGAQPSREEDSEGYAPYLPPKWREDKAKEEE